MSQLSAPADSADEHRPVVADFDDTATRRARRFMSGGLLALGLLLLKLKSVLFLLGAKFKVFLVNPFEGFSIGQLLLTGGSMVVSLVAYGMKFDGWYLATGIVAVLFIHELGHAIMIRARGLRAGAMVFIPFIGGAVTLRQYPRSVFVDAQIGLAGPVFGTIAALGFLQAHLMSGSQLMLWIAHFGFVINLFNLTPVRPLDGGRIAAAITKWMWAIGALILVGFLVIWQNPLLLLLVILSVVQIYGAITREKVKRFYAITPRKRLGVAVVYFGLVSFLAYASLLTHSLLR